jgi:putative ABC transport system permease protein
MSILMTIRIALKALGRNKLRTALTALGMIIGVGAVITMVGIGSGAQTTIEDQIKSAGTNLITVNSGNFNQGGVRMGMGSSTRLSQEDADAIRLVDGVQYVSESTNTRGQVIAGNQNWNTRVEGANVDLPLIRSWPMKYGMFFTPQDVTSASKVCVLGTTTTEMLFGPDVDPTGQMIRIRNQPFKIIGVLASKGQGTGGQDQDDTIIVPYTTVMKKLQGQQNINEIKVSAVSAGQVDQVAEAIRSVMRIRHEIPSPDQDDFTVRTQEEIASVRTATTRTLTTFITIIAGVSLIVGGIGIMNIMLVSVTERTREIGLRMAIGARGRDVLLQFLVEAIVLSLFGGLVGIALGFGLAEGARRFLEWPVNVPVNSIAIAFGVAAGIGVFFGFYPATKAAGLDPIEALRYE